MSGPADRWIKSVTIDCLALLPLIAGTVSYMHMHMLVARHGQLGWIAALTTFSVDGVTGSVALADRFPREVIAVAVRWYLRYGCRTGTWRSLWLTGVSPSITSASTGGFQRFTPEFIEAAGICCHAPGDRWFVDETYVKVAGRWAYLYRAVALYGQVIDVLLSVRRDLVTARQFFSQALRAGTIPAEVTTDRAPADPRVSGCTGPIPVPGGRCGMPPATSLAAPHSGRTY